MLDGTVTWQDAGMECQSCAPAIRKDKPHTFLMHEMSACPTCAAPVEARVVARDGKIVHLLFCAACGQSERAVHDDATAYMADFVARGQAAVRAPGEQLLKQTTSTCPKCLKLLVCDVVARDGKVFFKKICPDCGPSEALVSEDASYYVRAYAFARRTDIPCRHLAMLPCRRACAICSSTGSPSSRRPSGPGA